MANPFNKNPVDLVIEEMGSGEAPGIAKAPNVERVEVRAPKSSKSSKSEAERMESLMPIFEKAAVDNGVPLNVIMALGWQESGFDTKAVGMPTKWGQAKGVMQYLDGTASRLGIDPMDPSQAINAAAKQLRERLDNGYSMEDAVKEHFAGPNRKLWGAKTEEYGKQVLNRANIIANQLGAPAPEVDFTNTPPSPLKPEDQNAWADARGLPKPFAESEQPAAQHPTAKENGSPVSQSVMKPYEPTIWDKILDLIGPNRDAAAVELAAQRIAERDGKDVREVYNEAGGHRALINPEGRAPIRAASEAAKVVYDQKGDIAPGAANAVLRAVRGGDTTAEDTALDRAISATEVKPNGYQDPNYTSFQGIGQSLGYSASTMVPALLAGAAGTYAGGPVAGGAAAAGASGSVAYRSSKDQFLSDVVGKAEREAGRRLTQPELDKVVSDADEAATMYGAWEAIPEALSNVIMMRAVVAPLKGANRAAKVADLSRRFATEQASEQGTETATTWGQNKAELMAGLSNYDMSLGEAFRQQAIPTLFSTAAMGGAGHAARAAYDATHSKQEKFGRALNEQVESTQLQADPAAAAQAFDPNNAQAVQPAPTGPLGRAMQNAPIPTVAQTAPSPEQIQPQAMPEQATQEQAPQQGTPEPQEAIATNQVAGAQPQRVKLTIAGEDTAATVIEQLPEGLMVQDDNGDKYLLPAEAIQSGEIAITPVDQPAAETQAPQQQEATARTEPKPYDQMTAGELNQRLAYIKDQGKTNGWDGTLAQEKAKVEDAIATLREREISQRDEEDTQDDEPQQWGGLRSMFDQEFRQPEVNNEPEQVREPENGSALVPENTTQDGETRPADLQASREVAQVREAGAGRVSDDAGMVVADNGASVSATAQPADAKPALTEAANGDSVIDEVEREDTVLSAPSSAESKSPVQSSETKPALTEIPQVLGADGKPKWFGSKPKAVEFIAKKGLSDTHEVKKVGQKWEIHQKDQQAQAQQQAEIADRPATSVSGEAVTAPVNAEASPTEQPSSKAGQLPADQQAETRETQRPAASSIPRATDYPDAKSYRQAMLEYYNKNPRSERPVNTIAENVSKLDRKIENAEKRLQERLRKQAKPGLTPPAIIQNAIDNIQDEIKSLRAERKSIVGSMADNQNKSASAKRAYHGSLTRGLSNIDDVRGMDANMFGRGVYLTSDPEEAQDYASTSVYRNRDLVSKIEMYAKANDISYEEAKEKLRGNGGAVYEVEYNPKNPFVASNDGVDLSDERALRYAMTELDIPDDQHDDAVRRLQKFANNPEKLMRFLQDYGGPRLLRQYASIKNHDAIILKGSFVPASERNNGKNIEHTILLNPADGRIVSSRDIDRNDNEDFPENAHSQVVSGGGQSSASSNPADEPDVVKGPLHSSLEIEKAIGKFASGLESAKIEHDKSKGDYAIVVDGIELGRSSSKVLTQSQALQIMLRTYRDAMDRDGRAFSTNPKEMTRDQFIMFAEAGMVNDVSVTLDQVSQHASGGFRVDYGKAYDEMQASDNQPGNGDAETQTPEQWKAEAEAALSRLPDTHPLKKKWAANVKNGLKSASDRAAVLKQINGAIERTAPHQDQAKEQDKQEQATKAREQIRKEQAQRAIDRSAEAIGAKKGEKVRITGKVGYAGDKVYTVEDIDSKGNVYLKSDTGSTDVSPADIQRAKAQGTTFAKVEDQAAEPLAELSGQAAQHTDDRFAGNKLFTADKVAAARARLKAKMSQLNSGLDPEIMIDGITLAGAYIEAGVRDFSAYAKEMTADFGDKIKPYLLSFWEGARHYPGLDSEGMTSAEDSAKAHAELNKELPKEEAKALGSEVKKPAKRTKKNGGKGDATLTQDWGVDRIDGYGDNYERETGNAVKDQFLNDAAKYLGALADLMQEAGFTEYKGKKPVNKNEGGPAVSGDVSLTLRNPKTGQNLYVHVGESSLRGVVPTTPSGIAVMYRTSDNEGDTLATKGSNRWAPVDMSAADLAAIIKKEVGGTAPVLARQPIEDVKDDTQASTAVGRGGAQDDESSRVQAHEADRAHRASPGRASGDVQSERGGRAAGSTEQTGGEESDSGSASSGVRGNRASGNAAGARSDQSNYRIQAGELTRTGSWKATAEQNVKIVELVKQLMKEGRPATAAEKALLTKFTGWGASEIANGIFPNQYGQYKDSSWRELGERLKAALTEEEYAQARRTTQYAHYTSEPIIRSVYKAMARMGFNGGNVLEPGMGVGLFNGLMPDSIAGNSEYTGIEYDTITGNIAKLLYPNSNMIVGDYTQTKLPRDFFDAAIGNPPFGAIKIQSDPEYKKQGFMLHDYFFAKTIDRVKPGGLLVFVTSKGTMDKANDRARKYLSERADLVGAIRLPQTAFKDNAGTEVVTDVIFLRKRAPGEEAAGEKWEGLGEVNTAQGPAMVNEYFAAHPEMVLGRHAKTGSMYRADEYTVEPIEGNIEELFAKAIDNLPENIYKPERGSTAERAAVRRRDYDPKVKKEGGIYIADDGSLMQVENGQGVPLNTRIGSAGKELQLKPKEVEWLKGYTAVRDALKQAQYDQLNDGPWEKSLKALNEKYDAFTKKHGPILAHTVIERERDDGTTIVTKRFKNQPLIQMDAEGALAYALEDIKPDGSIAKAPVLLGRTLNKPKQPNITSVQDAMFVSLNEIGRFDLKAIAKLSGKTEQEVVSELGSEIYQDPSNGWTTADEYLSGNVVRKLKEAEAAARINKDYERNIEALKSVQPRPLASADITVQLGSAWVPPSDVQEFASEVINEPGLEISYSPVTGQWQVKGQASRVSEWGLPQRTTDEILESVLNNRQIKITYRDNEGKTHTDAEATEKANDLAKKMRAEFKKWIWADNDRAIRLTNYYNEHYNNIAPRQFDGSHLTLPGVTSRFQLRPHQKRAIWRTIQEGDTYYAHAVGAGKTFTMIAAGMEERRLGLVKKPMYVVPNHMLTQFSKEFLELYPTASIMVADEQNFHTNNRRKFVAQAALNDPDAIVITHSAFGLIGMSDEFSKRFINNQIADWQAALEETDKQDRVTVKQIERRIEQLENRLKAVTEGAKDRVLTFEELGVDRLYVDEGHEFRKLDFPTNRANIKGIDSSGSQRAMDLMMKVQYIRGKNPGRAIVMASGTPITNTMGELYTVQRYFQPEILEEDGDSSFDAWANHYGEVVDGLEQNAAGGYETVSRFARFVNVPELMSRVRSFMDILTSSQLGDLVQRPDVENGGRQVVVTPVPDGYKEYQKELESRIKAIRNRRGPPKPGDDIILNVIADGRFSAIDMRFVDPTLPSDPNSKLNKALDDLIEVYHATADNEYTTGDTVDPVKGSAMMLFTDIGLGEQSAKNRGFDMKAWIEKRLIEGGVKPEHIAFMRDHKAHAKKERLFDDLRQGRKRILIGGKDMETGVNAQKRLIWLGHLDAPWFPASVEQREGRIIRQGNQNKLVVVKAYATKGSYDSTMWGMNSRKARFIEQAMSGDASVRSMDDVSEASAFEMAAALASGDERYMKLAGLKADVDRLNRLYSAHMDDQRRLRSDKVSTEGAIRFNKEKLSALDEAIAKRTTIKAGSFSGKVGGKTFDNREEFGAALIGQFTKLANEYTYGEKTIGAIGGFDIKYQGIEMRGGSFAAEAYVDAPTEADPLIVFPQPGEASPAGVATRAVNIVNGLDREKANREQRLAEFEENLTRINKRLGVAFPEAAELTEKREAMAELEAELEAESAAAAEVDGNETSEAKNDTGERYSIADTIEVDGKQRPTTNSNGQQIHATEEGIRNFWRWFGDSKVVDGQGRPLVVYHGSPDIRGIVEGGFKPSITRGGVYFFSDSQSVANTYADPKRAMDYQNAEDHVIPVYLSVSNPSVVDAGGAKWRETERYVSQAKNGGNDGIVIRNSRDEYNNTGNGGKLSTVYAAFSPTQIKSAAAPGILKSRFDGRPIADISNTGGFSQESADIRYSIGSSAGGLMTDPLIKSLVDSGKIVIHDTTDTLPSQRKAGVSGFTAADGTIHVVGNNLSVVLHEAFHSGGKALLGDKRWQNLISRLESMHKAAKSSDGFWKGAADRVARAGVTGKLAAEEFGAYAIENYDRAPAGVRKWVESMAGAVQAWLYRRFGIQVGKVSAAQLRSLAKAALRSMNEPGPVGPNGWSRMVEAYSQAANEKSKVEPLSSRLVTKAMPAMLQAVSLDRMIEELGNGMPSLKAYLREKRQMDAYRNTLHAKHDAIANDWLKFNMLHPAMGKLLASIMHKSTIEQVDPTLPFVETVTKSDWYEAEMNPDSPEGKAAAERIADDERRFAAWKELKDDFNKLPEKGKSLYTTVRDAYLDQVIELDKILIDNLSKALDVQAQRAERKYNEEVQRIYDEGMAGDERDEALRKAENKYISASTKHKYNKSARILELRRKFESNRLTGPYFPLARFGNYFVTGRDQEGKVIEFSKFENPTDQQRFAAELEKEGLEVQQGYLYDSEQLKKAIDSGFVADVDEILSSADVSDAVKDQIWQRYIDSMPEMSMRKKFKHRKNREGYNKDALRAFASQMFHGAHQMARLKYGAQMTEHIEQAKHEAKAAKDPVRAAQVVNEVEQKHQFVMNPTGSQWVQNLSALGFVYHLTSPASALVNFAQTYILGVPILGAKFGRFGMARAGFELTRAMKDFAAGMGHIGNRKNLSSDERAALEYAYQLGVADRTQSHDLAGIGENGSAYSPLRATVMRKLGWAFHQVERMNREVTYIAAYRMSRDKGMDRQKAMDNAAELTWKVHFNYDNSNRPRRMQTDFAKVFLMFRNYQVNMLWRLFRDAHQVFNGASKEERSEALKQLGGITGMMALSTGIRGVWLYGIAMVIANMMFGDDAEDKMKKGLIEAVGKDGAGIIMNGLGGHLTGIDLSGRIGMPDLWIRSPDQNLEGKDAYTYLLEQFAGPLFGIANNAFVGAQMAGDGNVYRGLETASPTAIKSALRAYRYGTEGVNTLKDEPIVQDISYADIIKQAIGFTPIKVAEQYRTNRVMKNKEQEIGDTREGLLNRYNMAMKREDDKEADKVLTEIEKYNDQYPEWPILPKNIRASYRSFMRTMNRTQGGVILNKRLEGMIREDAAPSIYQDGDAE